MSNTQNSSKIAIADNLELSAFSDFDNMEKRKSVNEAAELIRPSVRDSIRNVLQLSILLNR